MRIALTYNRRPLLPMTCAALDDTYAEWDDAATIAAVQHALAMQHDVTLVEATLGAEATLRALAPDMVFNLAEGLGGVEREARLPAFLERQHIPFTGSSARTLRLCLDKAATKRVLRAAGLPTPAFTVLRQARYLPASLRFPVIVKPVHEGSSKGISTHAVVHTAHALRAQVTHVLSTYAQPALVEAFVPGREFTVALLGNGPQVTVLPLVEVCFAALPPGAAPIYSYEAKWLWDTPAHPLDLFRCPAEVPLALARTIACLCQRAFQVLGCYDWCRIDLRLDAVGQPYILEVNPLPGIAPDPESHSCFPCAAAAAQLTYPQLIHTVLALACQRYGLASPPILGSGGQVACHA